MQTTYTHYIAIGTSSTGDGCCLCICAGTCPLVLHPPRARPHITHTIFRFTGDAARVYDAVLSNLRRCKLFTPTYAAAAGQLNGAATGQLGKAATGQLGKAATGQLGKAATGQLGKAATGQLGKAATGQLGKAATGQLGKAATGQLGKAATGQLGKAATGQLGKAATGQLGKAATGRPCHYQAGISSSALDATIDVIRRTVSAMSLVASRGGHIAPQFEEIVIPEADRAGLLARVAPHIPLDTVGTVVCTTDKPPRLHKFAAITPP